MLSRKKAGLISRVRKYFDSNILKGAFLRQGITVLFCNTLTKKGCTFILIVFFFQSETPQNLSAIALSWNTVKVTWTPLDEKEEVTSYDVEYCSVIGCRIVPVFDSSVVIDNLTQHTTYTVKTRGRNTKYTGPWRIASGVKTLGTRNRMTYASFFTLCSLNHRTH